MSRVLKWPIDVDDQWHEVGRGPVVMVACAPGSPPTPVFVWTIEPDKEENTSQEKRLARVYGTGHIYPNDAVHLGSCQAGIFVWHVVSVMDYGIKFEEIPSSQIHIFNSTSDKPFACTRCEHPYKHPIHNMRAV